MKNKLRLYTLIGILISCLVIPAPVSAANATVYTAFSASDMENIISAAIKGRVEAFKIIYTGDTGNIMNDIRQARDSAVKEDQYEEGCISLIAGFTVSNSADHADISFDSFKYYTTKEQEQYVDQKVQAIVSGIINPHMSGDQKERAVYDYIIRSVTYDYTLEGYTAYSALKNGSTVCNGYVQLAYRLLKAAGIETMIVKGKYSGRDHEWNLARINNHWYHLDTTLEDTLSGAANSGKYRYFNLTDDEISVSHQYNKADYPTADTRYIQPPEGSQPPQAPSTGGIASPAASITAAVGVKLPAAEETVEINKFNTAAQAADKVWTLQFNQPIDFSTVNPKSVFVVDSSGNIIKGVTFTKGTANNVLLVRPPEGGFVSGKSYCLYIMKGIFSDKGKGLDKALKIPFRIK